MNIRNFLSDRPTPYYHYDLLLFRQTLASCKAAAAANQCHVHYAVKANFNEPILSAVLQSGLGVDCVSWNEARLALDIGFSKDSIVFAGVGKTDEEIRNAINADIFCINCESIQELEVIDAFAAEAGKTAPVAIRLNPNVEADTHHFITTGTETSKFGIALSQVSAVIARLTSLKNIRFMGLHFHIGSQISDMVVFHRLSKKIKEIKNLFNGAGLPPQIINFGGGLGVDYYAHEPNLQEAFENYFSIFHQYFGADGIAMHFELGRSLVATCGTLITKVLYVKPSGNTQFIIVDAGMTELLRPALYQAHHEIVNLTHAPDQPQAQYDIGGPVCESSDFFRRGITLPITKRGDILAILFTGAYGEVMSSRYNLREKAKAYYSGAGVR